MVQNLLNKLKKLDNKTKQIMKYGYLSAFVVSIISCIILLTYQAAYASPDLYYIGLQVFKMSLMICVSFFVCGFAFDKIKSALIK